LRTLAFGIIVAVIFHFFAVVSRVREFFDHVVEIDIATTNRSTSRQTATKSDFAKRTQRARAGWLKKDSLGISWT